MLLGRITYDARTHGIGLRKPDAVIRFQLSTLLRALTPGPLLSTYHILALAITLGTQCRIARSNGLAIDDTVRLGRIRRNAPLPYGIYLNGPILRKRITAIARLAIGRRIKGR